MIAPPRSASVWILATLLLWICVALLCWTAMRWSDGHFAFALDDAYIHMAVARNVVVHGVWGVTPAEFTSATSSLAWPSILAAGFAVLGAREWLPLVLDLVCAAFLLRSAQRVLESGTVRPPRLVVLGGLLAVTFLSGLPAVILTGLEHVLHAWLNLVFCYAVGRALSGDNAPRGRHAVTLVGLAVLLPLVRFEALAVVGLAAVLHVLRRRWRLAFALAAAGLAPVGAYGALSLALGWWVLPNSVLLKSNEPTPEVWTHLGGFLELVGSRCLHAPDLIVLLAACIVLDLVHGARGRSPREIGRAHV